MRSGSDKIRTLYSANFFQVNVFLRREIDSGLVALYLSRSLRTKEKEKSLTDYNDLAISEFYGPFIVFSFGILGAIICIISELMTYRKRGYMRCRIRSIFVHERNAFDGEASDLRKILLFQVSESQKLR